MTISSSLYAGVAGLNANANKLGTISDNIANSSTYGYKRVQTDFYSVVVHGNTSTSYSAGGVRSTSMRLVDERGPLIGTNNSTYLAVDGRGAGYAFGTGAFCHASRDSLRASISPSVPTVMRRKGAVKAWLGKWRTRILWAKRKS